MSSLSEWQTFLSVQASAAATFTGLVFVAISINLGRIMSVPGLAERGSDSLAQFLQVFFVSTLALVPRQPVAIVAGEILGVTAASWGLQVFVQIRYARSRSGHPLSWLIPRVVMTQLASLPFWITGILLLFHDPNALFWLVPGFFLSFIAGVTGAWVLLIEILR